jgi:hypothetical protein
MKKDFRSITQIYRDMNKPQINEALANTASMEYGTKIARDEYAKDTPGQSPGDPIHEPTHASKAKFGLSVNGVPNKGGEMDKPNFTTTTGIKVEGHNTQAELVDEKKKLDPVGKADADIDNDGDVDTSDKYLHNRRKAIKKEVEEGKYSPYISIPKSDPKKVAQTKKEIETRTGHARNFVKPKPGGGSFTDKNGVKTMSSEGIGDMVKKGVEKVKKVRNDIKNFHKTDTAAAIRLNKHTIFRKEGFQVPEYSVFAEAMSVTLRPSKSQPGSYKVHSVGSKMKAHGGMKPGERVKDHEIDYLHDSGIKVKYHKEDTDLDEAGRWDDTTTGRRYRGMSPEEKKRIARTNALKKKAKAVYKGRGELDRVSEAMSPLDRKQAAAKIFKMHQAKKSNAQKAKSAAMRDSSGYKTYDDSHLDAKPSPKPKGKKGVSDVPHIVGQLRGVVDTKGNHKGVQFKDGSTHKVSADHAKSWLAKHDSSKPADKMKMYKHHDSHKAFKSGMSEESTYTDKQVRMAKGIAFDKRHVGGDYTGAAKKMEKIKKGLSDHPIAKDALRRANEQKDFAKSLFNIEAIERRADRKTIIATDPATGRKVVKMAPKKEIDIGKGKMA